MADMSGKLQRAISALQNNNNQAVLQMCDQMLLESPHHPDVFHIKALAAKNSGMIELAESCFLSSLQYLPNQPAVISNLANLLMARGQVKKASDYYQQAVRLSAENIDAWYNWAVWLGKHGQFDAALEVISQAEKAGVNAPKLSLVKGTTFQKVEEYENALACFDIVLSKHPQDVNTRHHKASTLRMMLKPKAAIEILQQLLSENQSYPELYFNIGCAFYDLGQLAQASEYLLHAIKVKPDYVDAHEALSKLRWENGQSESFTQSYIACLKEVPDSIPLRYSYIAMLLMADKLKQAEVELKQAIQQFNNLHVFTHALAVLHNKQQNIQDVLTLLQSAVSQDTNNSRYQIDIANYYIKDENYSLALEHLQKVAKKEPLNQEIMAYQGLCWRLTNDPMEKWLNDYSKFVSAEYLEVPENYDNMQHFLCELRDALTSMHSTVVQPLDQSVRGGTQTVGRLLSEQVPVIQDFKRVLFRRIERYLHQLPEDLAHPFLGRNTRRFRVTGSWSVRLKEGGFHTNHVHPLGWLSCCNYISVPQQISPQDPDKSGWIKFGETSLELAEREHIGKSLCPEEGLSVLFPSFMWHGTNPFTSEDYRMTIPCDIAPITREIR